jgi:hypothetical protein
MLGENDGPSMVSYTATGAAYGMGFFLPFIVATFAMAIICQAISPLADRFGHRVVTPLQPGSAGHRHPAGRIGRPAPRQPSRRTQG